MEKKIPFDSKFIICFERLNYNIISRPNFLFTAMAVINQMFFF